MIDVIKIPDEKKVVFISDPHFCHKKLSREVENHFLMCRNYDTVAEMNSAIIENINAMTDHNTVLVILGDVIFGCPDSKLHDTFYEIFDKLICDSIIMVFGNHDHKLYKKLGDDNVIFHPYAMIAHRGKTYFCQHHDFNECPVYLEEESKKRKFENLTLVHGHTHSMFLTTKYGNLTQNCVCYDVAYRPLKEDELYPADADVEEHITVADVSYYEEIAQERGMGLAQLIDDQIHHSLSREEVCANAREVYERYNK